MRADFLFNHHTWICESSPVTKFLSTLYFHISKLLSPSTPSPQPFTRLQNSNNIQFTFLNSWYKKKQQVTAVSERCSFLAIKWLFRTHIQSKRVRIEMWMASTKRFFFILTLARCMFTGTRDTKHKAQCVAHKNEKSELICLILRWWFAFLGD